MEYRAAYKNLDVWSKANELALSVYRVTKKFPKDELFGLISQMRRAAVSVPANIVEGYSRNTKKDRVHFYYFSRGSLTELEYYIDLSLQLDYITNEEHHQLIGLKNDAGRLLYGFINSSA